MSRLCLPGVLILCVICLSVFPDRGQAQSAPEVLLVGDASYPPYMFDDGAYRGIYVDLIREAARRLEGYQVKISLLPWKRAVAAVESGEAFGLIGTYGWPERHAAMDPFSNQIFTEDIVVYCANKFLRPGMKYPNDFQGRIFALNLGFMTAGPEFSDLVRAGKIKIEEYPSSEANVRKLIKGRVDCYVNDRLTIEKLLNRLGGTDAIGFAAEAGRQAVYFGYSRTFQAPWRDDFIVKMNAALEEIQRDGTMRKILSLYTQ